MNGGNDRLVVDSHYTKVTHLVCLEVIQGLGFNLQAVGLIRTKALGVFSCGSHSISNVAIKIGASARDELALFDNDIELGSDILALGIYDLQLVLADGNKLPPVTVAILAIFDKVGDSELLRLFATRIASDRLSGQVITGRDNDVLVRDRLLRGNVRNLDNLLLNLHLGHRLRSGLLYLRHSRYRLQRLQRLQGGLIRGDELRLYRVLQSGCHGAC